MAMAQQLPHLPSSTSGNLLVPKNGNLMFRPLMAMLQMQHGFEGCVNNDLFFFFFFGGVGGDISGHGLQPLNCHSVVTRAYID